MPLVTCHFFRDMKKNTDYGFSLLHPTSVYLYLTIIGKQCVCTLEKL